MTGDFSQVVAETVAAAGGTGSFVGRFVALRTDDPVPDDAFGALEQLIVDAESITNAAKAGEPIDVALLLDALRPGRARGGEHPRQRRVPQHPGPLAATFTGSLGVVVADLIAAVVTNPTGITLATLQAVVEAGVRMGVLSSNASPGSESESLGIQLEAEFDLRLTAAIGPPVNVAEVQQILATATVMGWSRSRRQGRGGAGRRRRLARKRRAASRWWCQACADRRPRLDRGSAGRCSTGTVRRRGDPTSSACSRRWWAVGLRGAGTAVASAVDRSTTPTPLAPATEPASWFVVALDADSTIVAPAPRSRPEPSRNPTFL